ncbi:MAG: hypothetical protein HY751_00760 [Nitrospinae bacterium]|nr:hypothetical protein [Nitrospinota bacterium]
MAQGEAVKPKDSELKKLTDSTLLMVLVFGLSSYAAVMMVVLVLGMTFAR